MWQDLNIVDMQSVLSECEAHSQVQFKGKLYDYKNKSCSVDRRVIEKGTEHKSALWKEIEQTD